MKLLSVEICSRKKLEKELDQGSFEMDVLLMQESRNLFGLLELLSRSMSVRQNGEGAGSGKKYSAGNAHMVLSALLKIVAGDLEKNHKPKRVLKIMARDGIIIPFDRMLLPDDADANLTSVSDHFRFYEKIVDADEFASIRK